MKKIVVILCFLIFSFLIAAYGFCQGVNPTLRAEELEGFVGDILEVSVFYENPARIAGGEFVLIYDPSVVEPLEIKRGNLTKSLDGFLFLSNRNYSDSSIKVSWVGLKEISSAGTLSKISFLLIEKGNTELVISEPMLTDKKGFRVNPVAVNGSIAVFPESFREGNESQRPIPGNFSRVVFMLAAAAMGGAFFWKHRRGRLPAGKERKF
jgi:hypothetical protein